MAALGGPAPYYEKDAALRAYANRVVILAAFLGLVVVVLAAIVLTTRANAKAHKDPSDLEKKKNFVITFVNAYWSYDEVTLPEHWSKALNMMTPTLKQDLYTKMIAKGTVAELENEHDKSELTLFSIEADQSDTMIFHVLATRVDTTSKDGRSYSAEKKAEFYTIRMVTYPSGLLVSDFKRDEIASEPYTLNKQ